VTEIEVLNVVRRAATGDQVTLSYHADVEKAFEKYYLQRADVLHALETGEQAIADTTRPTVWTIVGRIQSDNADDATQNRRWAVVADIDADVFVFTIHPHP
jgi:hypothetical protein